MDVNETPKTWVSIAIVHTNLYQPDSAEFALKKALRLDDKYSKALIGLQGVWDIEALNKYLTKPAGYAPGTAMSFAGLKKDSDRANLIQYLNSLNKYSTTE